MLLKGKKGLITGVANDMSIATAIAKLAKDHGAEVAISHQKALKSRAKKVAKELNIKDVFECEVMDSKSTANLFKNIKNNFGEIDFVLHSIVYADKSTLTGKYLNTSLKDFNDSLAISCYSLNILIKESIDLMKKGGSILTLSYHGAQKVMPSYNLMGVAKAALEASVRYLAADVGENNIRVNALSTGPVRTLASSAVTSFPKLMNAYSKIAPLKRNITKEDIAKSALYFLSDLSSGVSGETHYVDCGYNIMGVGVLE